MQKALITAAFAGSVLLASAPAFAQTRNAPTAPASPTDQPALPEQHVGQLNMPWNDPAATPDKNTATPSNTSKQQR